MLLLLQGYGGTAADWDPTFLFEMERSFTVVRPDPRGMGDSTIGDRDEPLTVASMADDALAVLDACGADDAVVVGWSMGGFVAQTLTGAEPERVTGLALIGTDAGGPDAVVADREVWARLTDTSGTPREQASRLLHLLFPMPLADSVDAEVGDLVAAARAAIDPEVLRMQERAIVGWRRLPWPTPGSVVPPTVAVAGADDTVIPPANLERLVERWPECRTVVYEGAGHAVMAQEPAAIAELVRSLAG